ncbi:MAG: hypothetical protein A3F72_01935 [Bacteroidetes bacterium RIFCSPLOWO2_12_FULL_35_15]|nr:MAG: hypothetical protein A3F72_01935 [Bacteroidetes bacterium RIFCSPLOWO2_12_FULL_35_15]
MKKIITLTAIFIVVTNNLVISNPKVSLPFNTEPHLKQLYFIVERGLEIRYYVLNSPSDVIPTVINIENINYDVYKTKTEAINAIQNASIKKDYCIVYVISEQAKETEYVVID